MHRYASLLVVKVTNIESSSSIEFVSVVVLSAGSVCVS